MKSNIILLLVLIIFVVSVTTTQSECVRCMNGIVLILLSVAYLRTSEGKELANIVYNQIIK